MRPLRLSLYIIRRLVRVLGSDIPHDYRIIHD